MSQHLNAQIVIADGHRQSSRWQEAIAVYRQIEAQAPRVASIKQNLALCHFAMGEFKLASQYCEAVIRLSPELWQARILLGKCYRQLERPLEAETQFKSVLVDQPTNGEALIGLADLSLNEFGEPLAAIAWIKPLLANPDYQQDAQLTCLMASLYERQETALSLNQKIMAFSKAALQLPPEIMPRYQHAPQKAGHSRLRVGVISPFFSASPVYFLTSSFFKDLSRNADLVFFNRGSRSDWATQAFKAIASDWFEVASLSAPALASYIYAQGLDVLYDLGGWSDPVALSALSVKPARTQYKWVGGQSVTTGLDCFDGWLGDHWQSPASLQALYTEPLINAADDYAHYTPPPYLPAKAAHKSPVLGIFANPAKVSHAFLQRLASIPGQKCFIHRQFRHDRVRARIEAALNPNEVSYVCPETHLEALEAVNAHATLIDTFPYSSGLTAREAIAMGTKIQVLEVGTLFCERHTARYQS
jgi:predicted O-linked N-acetylglucosamine transferase (SPINDLY family)